MDLVLLLVQALTLVDNAVSGADKNVQELVDRRRQVPNPIPQGGWVRR